MASLLTVALHGKLEYFTDILRTLLSDLVAQYVAKNPKLMLRRYVAVRVQYSRSTGGRARVLSLVICGTEPCSPLLTLAFPLLLSQDRDCGGEAAHQLDVHLPLHLCAGESGAHRSSLERVGLFRTPSPQQSM